MSMQIVKFVVTPHHHLLGFSQCLVGDRVEWFSPDNRYFAADSAGVIHRQALKGKPECDAKVRVGPIFRSAELERLLQAPFCEKCFNREMISETIAIAETVLQVVAAA